MGPLVWLHFLPSPFLLFSRAIITPAQKQLTEGGTEPKRIEQENARTEWIDEKPSMLTMHGPQHVGVLQICLRTPFSTYSLTKNSIISIPKLCR